MMTEDHWWTESTELTELTELTVLTVLTELIEFYILPPFGFALNVYEHSNLRAISGLPLWTQSARGVFSRVIQQGPSV